MHELLSCYDCILKITMQSICTQVQSDMTGKWYYAEYTTFSLDSESNQYAINISGYVGNAGDSLADTNLTSKWYLNGMKFTTYDENNNRSSIAISCGTKFSAGWWFNNCAFSCLTCKFTGLNFVWLSLTYAINEPTALLKTARMMIRSN